METQTPMPGGSSGSLWNHFPARVISILHGLTRITVKVMTDDEVTLTVRCPSEMFERMNVRVGQQVMARVNAHDVLVGKAGVWPGKERWNRWSGRIVLVGPEGSAPLITVKLQGKSRTLMSTGAVIGLSVRPQAWEQVTIVIDPENVTLIPQRRLARTRWTATPMTTQESSRVWLKAEIEAIRKADGGCIVSLDVGGARVSALLYGNEDILPEWSPGAPVEMHVGQWEAWIRPAGGGVDAVMCKLMYE